jgi:hypothetical protein
MSDNTSIFDTTFSFDSDKPSGSENPALVFVTKVGEVNERPVYEFIFSNEPDSAVGPQWENICQYNVEPPLEKWISLIARIEPEDDLVFTLLEELDNFRYLDGVFGAVALAWEFIEDYSDLANFNTELLAFRYGEKLDMVKLKLESRGLDFKTS